MSKILPAGERPNHHPIYMAAKAFADFYRTNNGCTTGELVRAVIKAVDDYDDLTIPDFLRRKIEPPADEWIVVGGTDGKDQ